MKFTISKPALIASLGAVRACLHTHTTLPILGHIRLAVEGDRLICRATDLDHWLQISTPCQDASDGAICAPGETLYRIVQSLDSQEVSLHLDARQTLHIVAANSHFKLLTMSVSEFPAMPGDPPPKGEGPAARKQESSTPPAREFPPFVFSQPQLGNILRSISFAASDEATRVNLHGICLDADANALSCVASDGRRMAIVSAPHSQPRPPGTHVLPPAATCTLRNLLGEEGEVTLEFSEHWVHATFSDLLMISRLIAVVFPPYRGIIPDYPGPGIKLSRAQIIHALRSAAVFSERCRLTFEGHTLTLTSDGHADADFSMETIFLEEPAPNIYFILNTEYLMQGLEAAPQDSLRLLHRDNVSSLLFAAPETSWRYILMPLRPG